MPTFKRDIIQLEKSIKGRDARAPIADALKRCFDNSRIESLTDYLNIVLSYGYGEDVRGGIADAILARYQVSDLSNEEITPYLTTMKSVRTGPELLSSISAALKKCHDDMDVAWEPTRSRQWFCDQKGALLCQFWGRRFYKTNGGNAFVAHYNLGGFSGPLLVSQDPYAVIFDADGVEYANEGATIEYNGVTYYISSDKDFMNVTFGGNQEGITRGLNYPHVSYATSWFAALALLDRAVNVWECNTQGALLCEFWGRKFYKTTDGNAFIAYYNLGGFSGPLLVSQDPFAVAFDADGTTYYNEGATIEYNGEIYYISSDKDFMSREFGDNQDGIAHPLNYPHVEYATSWFAALDLLDIVSSR